MVMGDMWGLEAVCKYRHPFQRKAYLFPGENKKRLQNRKEITFSLCGNNQVTLFKFSSEEQETEDSTVKP